MKSERKPDCKLYILDGSGEKAFGRGPYLLLIKTQELGSLNKAAKEMSMAYSKAFHLIRNAEEVLGFALLESRTGGKGGGGSQLTDAAKSFLKKYAAWEKAVKEYTETSFHEFF